MVRNLPETQSGEWAEASRKSSFLPPHPAFSNHGLHTQGSPEALPSYWTPPHSHTSLTFLVHVCRFSDLSEESPVEGSPIILEVIKVVVIIYRKKRMIHHWAIEPWGATRGLKQTISRDKSGWCHNEIDKCLLAGLIQKNSAIKSAYSWASSTSVSSCSPSWQPHWGAIKGGWQEAAVYQHAPHGKKGFQIAT